MINIKISKCILYPLSKSNYFCQ